MNRRFRTVLACAGALALAVLLAAAFARTPGATQVYLELARPAGQAHMTPNLVSAINFDLRALDTLGEETIVAAAVVGTLSLLSLSPAERHRLNPDHRPVLPAVRAFGYLLLPVTVLLGIDVILHGHLTPGGGFQGGVVLATGWHLLYLAGDYPALARLRPIGWCEYAEAAGTGLYAATGLAGLVASGSFLTNFLPLGSWTALPSAGTVPLLSFFVGVEVAAGFVVLLARFLEQGLLPDKENA